jgi:hypothetical protein
MYNIILVSRIDVHARCHSGWFLLYMHSWQAVADILDTTTLHHQVKTRQGAIAQLKIHQPSEQSTCGTQKNIAGLAVARYRGRK